MGQVITPESIKLDPDKVECIEKLPTPKSKLDIQSFLGLAGYYRRFIKNFSSITPPLIEQTKKNCKSEFHWGKEANEAFETLRHYLVQPPILTYPQFDQEFLLFTVASNYGIGFLFYHRSRAARKSSSVMPADI